MWTGDNLDVLRGLNSESIDLVYADPPFNSNKNYEAPIGSKAAGAAFKDTWTLSDVDVAWHGEIAEREPRVYAAIDAAGIVHGKGMKSYLIMMAVRLLELRRVLKPTGSLYLHCDPTANAYLRLLLDAVFGREHFRNEVVWCYTGPSSPRMKNFPRKHDTIFRYTRGAQWTWHGPRTPYKDPKQSLRRAMDGGAGISAYEAAKYRERGKLIEDYWTDIALAVRSPKERIGYPTQKPIKLLDRIVEASSNPGDVVLDPFCGCATACVSAESLGREWIGIDLSPVAATLVESRLGEQFGIFAEIHHRTDVPRRTDLGDLPNYRTHKHHLFGVQEGRCAGCRMVFPFRNFDGDHVIAQSKGGSDHRENLQLLCPACNRLKGTGSQAALIAKLKERRLLAA